jgi:xanthine dehydrogenase accessory factor
MTAQIDDIRVPLAEAGGCCAIATLVEIAGSAPRECGAQMLITHDEYWGFLSGGCIEADVARHGREAMAEGAPRLLRYGEGSPWIDIKLACGSGITVLVEPVEADDPALAALLASHAARRPALWSSDGCARDAAPCDNAPAFAWDGARYTKLFEPATRLVLIGEDGAALAAAAIAMQALRQQTRSRRSGSTLGRRSRCSRMTARMTNADWPPRCNRKPSMSAPSARARGLMRGSPSCAGTG